MATFDLAQKSKKSQVETSDKILQMAHEIEQLTQPEAEALALELISSKGLNDFKLGGVLSVIKDNAWFNGMSDFSEYILKTFGLKYRKAADLLKIYNTLVDGNIPWEKVSMLGWNKLAALTKVITADNVDMWVEKAKSPTNYPTVLAMVKDALAQPVAKYGDETEEMPITSPVSKMAFTFHADQKAIVVEALSKAKEEVGTEYATVALENICLGYLGGSVAVATPKGSLREAMKEAGFMVVLSLFEDLWPAIDIELKKKDGFEDDPSLPF